MNTIEILKKMQLEQIDLTTKDKLKDAFYNKRLDSLREALVFLEKRDKIIQAYKESFQVELYYYCAFKEKTIREFHATKEKAENALKDFKDDIDFDEGEDEWHIKENIFNAEYFGYQVEQIIKELI